jgi:hypothetical protein
MELIIFLPLAPQDFRALQQREIVEPIVPLVLLMELELEVAEAQAEGQLVPQTA